MAAPNTEDGLPPKRFFIDEPWLREFVGARVIGGFAGLALRTARVTYVPENYLQVAASLEPAIFVCWHANLLATPKMAPDMKRLVNLTSPHPDGQMAGALSRAYGIQTISGSGSSSRHSKDTGALAGFRALLRAIRGGRSLFLTAEVPPTPNRAVAGGVVALARKSGRPIIPVAAASARRIIVDRLWDKMQIHLPFSHWAVVGAPALWVTDAMSEAEALATIKRDLDAAYARALVLADEKAGKTRP